MAFQIKIKKTIYIIMVIDCFVKLLFFVRDSFNLKGITKELRFFVSL